MIENILNPNSDVYILMKSYDNQNLFEGVYFALSLTGFHVWVWFFILPIKKKLWRFNKQQNFSYSEHWELSWIHSHNTLSWQNCVLDDSCAASVFRFWRLLCYFTPVGVRQNLVLCFFFRGSKALSDKKSLARPASVAYRKQNHFCLHAEKPLRDNMKITRHHSSHFAEDYCILIFH